MITSKDKLKLICNYKEELNEIKSNALFVTFVDMVSSDDEEYIRELKRKKRELIIDITLGDKNESELDKLENETLGYREFSNLQPINPPNNYGTISPQLYSLNLSSSKFVNYDDLYLKVIDFIDSNTSKPMNNKYITTSTDVNIVYDDEYTHQENFDINCRKILTKLTLNSNLIASTGKSGPGNTIIVGENNFAYLEYIKDVYGFKRDIIYDTRMDPNKVIICRNDKLGNNHINGLFLVDNSDYGKYFLKESHKWNSNFSWFWIK